MTIINLTQHTASEEQLNAGVVNLQAHQREQLSELLTFDNLPSAEEIQSRVEGILDLLIPSAEAFDGAMIGGAPFLMAPLAAALAADGITPLYAFSRRESVEQTMPDGSTRKTAVFRHLGFVPHMG